MPSKKDGRRGTRWTPTGRCLLLWGRVQLELDAEPQGDVGAEGPAGDDPYPRPTQKALRDRGGRLPHRRDGGFDPTTQTQTGDRRVARGIAGETSDREHLRGLGQLEHPPRRRGRGGRTRGGWSVGPALPADLQPLVEPHRDALAPLQARGDPLRAFPDHQIACWSSLRFLRALQPTTS